MSPYEVLRIPITADEESIRRAYRQRSLATHPDKAGPSSRPQFEAVQAAYKVLCQKPVGRCVISDEVEIGDMDDCGDSYFHQCRCGEGYSLRKTDAEDMLTDVGVVVPCSGCSLAVKIIADG